MRRGQNIRIYKSLKETDSQILMNNFDRLKISVKDVTGDMVETVRELELEVEPKNVPELLQ